MAKCELKVVLDEPGRVVRVGERVTGHVEVDVGAACTCNGLTLTQQWRTHGRGNTVSRPGEPLTLFTGEWRPGEVHRYPFEVQAQPGPLTYHGHYVNVDWYLEAHADIPWAIDPRAEAEYVLEIGDADPGELRQLDGPRSRTAPLTQDRSTLLIVLLLGGVAPFVLFGAVLTLVGIGEHLVRGKGGLLILGGLVSAGLPLAIALVALRNAFAQQKLGEVRLACEPDTVAPGGRTTLRLSLAPRAALDVQRITVTLLGEEVATSGSGTSKRTSRHTLRERAHELSGARRLAKHEPLELELELEVPPDAVASFDTDWNAVAWSCQVHVDIARWPDWTGSAPLVVLPRGATP